MPKSAYFELLERMQHFRIVKCADKQHAHENHSLHQQLIIHANKLSKCQRQTLQNYYDELKKLVLSLDHEDKEQLMNELTTNNKNNSTTTLHHLFQQFGYYYLKWDLECTDNKTIIRELRDFIKTIDNNNYTGYDGNHLSSGERMGITSVVKVLVYHCLGRLALDSLTYDQSLTDFNECLRYDCSFVSAMNNMGIALRALEKSDLALEMYTKAVRYCPTFDSAFNNRAIIYYDRMSYDLAIIDCNCAIALNPEYAAPLFNRGLCFEELGQGVLAYRDFGMAYRLSPCSNYYLRYKLLCTFVHDRNADELFK